MKERITFPDRENFRRWLQENGGRGTGIWLVFGKQGKVHTLTAAEALEEALCFGWIDGQLERVDGAIYLKYFCPRRKASIWSERNKGLAEDLIRRGRMTDRGLQEVAQAKRDGRWETPPSVSVTDAQIAAFGAALARYPTAAANFRKLPPSAKKQFVGFCLDAKKEETRRRRLEKVVGLLERNRRLM